MREQFSDSDLIAAIVDRHRAVLRAIHAGTAADWAGLDLTMPQLKVLLALDSVGPISIGAVGTVSYRSGADVYAFGHELDGAGRRSLADRGWRNQPTRSPTASAPPSTPRTGAIPIDAVGA